MVVVVATTGSTVWRVAEDQAVTLWGALVFKKI